LHDTKIADISYGEFESRRAIRSQVSTPFGPLLVVATHLGLSIRERRDQAKLTQTNNPVVLMGDFNDWFWPGSVRSVLRFRADLVIEPFQRFYLFCDWIGSTAGPLPFFVRHGRIRMQPWSRITSG